MQVLLNGKQSPAGMQAACTSANDMGSLVVLLKALLAGHIRARQRKVVLQCTGSYK